MSGPQKFVYFIKPVGLPGPIKIGCSADIYTRLKALASWSPWPLEIAAAVFGDNKLERNVHECFAKHHSHKEWFHGHHDILVVIEKIRSGLPIERAMDLSSRTGSILSEKARKRHTDESRKRLSYSHRLRCTGRRMRQAGIANYLEPHDVSAIIHRWSCHPKNQRATPTTAEFERLDQVLSRPSEHFITYEQKYSVTAPKPRQSPRQEAAA